MTPKRYTIHDAILHLTPGRHAVLIELHRPEEKGGKAKSKGSASSTSSTEGIIQNVHKAGINFVPKNKTFAHGILKGIPNAYVFLPDDRTTNDIFFLEA
jgi:hypothetical protein